MLKTLRYLRHGPLRSFKGWTVAGRVYRRGVKLIGMASPVEQRIGPYGPFKMHPHFAFSNFANWGGEHNSGFELCVEECRGKLCVLDVGAHIGLVTLPISRVLAPEGVVYAFEPSAANHDFLIYHAQANKTKNIETHKVLVGAEDKDDVPFYEVGSDSGMNALIPLEGKGNFTKVTRCQISLDNFCNEHDLIPEIIKIDVEGAEISVLEGAKETFRKCKPLAFLSVHPAHIRKMGRSLEELVELVADMDYKITHLDGSPVDEFSLNEYLLRPDEKN